MARALAAELKSITPDVEILTAATLKEALVLLRSGIAPTFLFLDLQLPDVNGLGHVATIKRLADQAKIAIVSGQDHPETMRAAFAAGAIGFIPKRLEPDALAEALRKFVSLGFYFPPEAVAAAALDSNHSLFTARELQLIGQLPSGKSRKVIADDLHVSFDYVKKMCTRVFRKLGVNSRSAAVEAARRRGLV